MANVMGLSLFVAGVVFLIFGFASDPSGLQQTFYANGVGIRPLWLLVGGALAVPLGIYVAWRGVRRQ